MYLIIASTFLMGSNAVQSFHCYSDSFIVIYRFCHPSEGQVLLFLMHNKQCMEVGMYQHFILVSIGPTYASFICFCWWSYFSISPSLSRLCLASEYFFCTWILPYRSIAGYQRQLNYKHQDGSYSTFGQRYGQPGNTWWGFSATYPSPICSSFSPTHL